MDVKQLHDFHKTDQLLEYLQQAPTELNSPELKTIQARIRSCQYCQKEYHRNHQNSERFYEYIFSPENFPEDEKQHLQIQHDCCLVCQDILEEEIQHQHSFPSTVISSLPPFFENYHNWTWFQYQLGEQIVFSKPLQSFLEIVEEKPFYTCSLDDLSEILQVENQPQLKIFSISPEMSIACDLYSATLILSLVIDFPLSDFDVYLDQSSLQKIPFSKSELELIEQQSVWHHKFLLPSPYQLLQKQSQSLSFKVSDEHNISIPIHWAK